MDKLFRAISRGLAVAASIWAAPALATQLVSFLITAPVAGIVSAPLQFREGNPQSAIVQCAFTFGGGGLTADAWIQTSLDDGATWTDVANCHFTTASARFLYNLSALTPKITEVIPTDGALAANTAIDGFVGPLWRIMATTTGTYTGGTTMRVDVSATGRLTAP